MTSSMSLSRGVWEMTAALTRKFFVFSHSSIKCWSGVFAGVLQCLHVSGVVVFEEGAGVDAKSLDLELRIFTYRYRTETDNTNPDG